MCDLLLCDWCKECEEELEEEEDRCLSGWECEECPWLGCALLLSARDCGVKAPPPPLCLELEPITPVRSFLP